MNSEPILDQFDRALSRSAVELRRWYIANILLAKPDVKQLEPSDTLLSMTVAAPSSEHSGIASRFVFDDMDRPTSRWAFPSISDPKTWNQPDTMVNLVFWLYKPWREIRYDPQSETIHNCLQNNQWVYHLKGKDSDGVLTRYTQRYLNQLRQTGFLDILALLTGTHDASPAFGRRPVFSLDPKDYGMDASNFATAMGACESHFYKFITKATSVKELVDQFQREPLMYFNTSVMNTMTDMAAFGNGVIATKDIIDDETGRPIRIAGKLMDTDREFMLGSAAGMEWPVDPLFEEFMDFRERLHWGDEHNTWDDWIDGSRQYAEIILKKNAPTYARFLEHAFPSNRYGVPDERDAFLRLLGAAVFGSNLKIVAAMIGAPNAGKDTVLKWLTMLMGEDQVGVLSPTALTPQADDQRAFAPLKGARVAVVSGEIGEGRGQAILAEKLKSITSGGGTLTVAEKYEKPTTIFFDGMLIMQGNSVPTILGGDQALFKNRLVAVEFKHPFSLTAKNFDYQYRTEASAFLQVLFLHYLDYDERGGGMIGIAPPLTWQQFASDVESNADQLTVIDRCITQPIQGLEIKSPQFYKALSILAERHLGLKYGLSSNRWASRLRKAGVNLSQDADNPWRTRVKRSDYNGWMLHFTLDADHSDGFFTQDDWTNALQAATMVT